MCESRISELCVVAVGQASIRPYWRCYYPNTDAIIYVVDSADTERVSICKDELLAMLDEEELKVKIMFAACCDDARCCVNWNQRFVLLGLMLHTNWQSQIHALMFLSRFKDHWDLHHSYVCLVCLHIHNGLIFHFVPWSFPDSLITHTAPYTPQNLILFSKQGNECHSTTLSRVTATKHDRVRRCACSRTNKTSPVH